MLIAIPCAVGMGVLAGPVMQLIFGDHSALARDLLTIGAPAVIFFSLSTVTNAVLQGIDLMRKSVTHSASPWLSMSFLSMCCCSTVTWEFTDW